MDLSFRVVGVALPARHNLDRRSAGCRSRHRSGRPLPAGTSSFVNGGGVTYTSADGAFLVQLPQSPMIDQRTITVDSVSATIYTAIAAGRDYEIGAASIALPLAISADRVNAVLE
jgi:hypothetical protein